MAFDAQKQIRENTLEMQEFLKDLKQWEHRVKEKDKKLKMQSEHGVSKIPPIRGRAERMSSTTKVPTKTSDLSERMNVESTSTTATTHTYDYHSKWDKFDVETALREADEEDVPELRSEKVTGNKAQLSANVQNQIGGTRQAPVSKFIPQADQGLGGLGTIDKLSGAFKSSESFPDATSEKELGNKYFKEKKFVQAIDCYSRSIALQPSAVAFANRGMAFIKIRRFNEAEVDCTEAIALDDRYVKAYSRRGTARKELGNFLAAVEDTEFALRLEPENKELKQQYLEAKSLCEKEAGVKLAETKIPLPIEEIKSQAISKPDNRNEYNQKDFQSSDQKLVSTPREGPQISNSSIQQGKEKTRPKAKLETLSEQPAENNRKALASVQAAAAEATAGRVIVNAVTVAPKTFYEFEAMWKSFSGNPSCQAELLKVINPSTLPGLFKDNLSPKLLSEIIRTLGCFFPESANVAVQILENLTKIRRFNITIRCLTSKEKAELRDLWESAFIGAAPANEMCEVLSGLRVKYQL